jgi:hypothetical protein
MTLSADEQILADQGLLLFFQPGFNSLMATIGRDAAPMSSAECCSLVAGALGEGLGVEVEPVGVQTSGQVYVIGQGRPVYVQELEPSRVVEAWYVKQGQPSGVAARYFSVSVDWRGIPARVEVPFIANVQFPGGVRPNVMRGFNWPDGTAEDQRKRVARENASAGTVEQGGAINQSFQDMVSAADRAADGIVSFVEKPLKLISANPLMAPLAIGAGIGVALLLASYLKKG